jgi:hypothetical protein
MNSISFNTSFTRLLLLKIALVVRIDPSALRAAKAFLAE